MRLTSPRARQQQERWLDDLAIKDRMRLCPVAKAPDVLCNDAPQKGKPEISSHGLRDADPVVAARPFHCLVALVNDSC